MTQKSDLPALAVGLWSFPVPFLRPAHRRNSDVKVNARTSEGRSSVSHCCVRAVRFGPMKHLACIQAGSQEEECNLYLFSFLFYQPFIPGKSTEKGSSSAAGPQLSIHMDKTLSFITVHKAIPLDQLGHKRCNSNVFPRPFRNHF